jgi:hypothetical protein
MRKIRPDLVCPGHRHVYPCNKEELDTYCDFIARKERVFRELVGEPADHYIDLFWARLLPYIAVVPPGAQVSYRLLVRNNLEKPAEYAARLLPPPGWQIASEYERLELPPGAQGEIPLTATAPPNADGTRRLMTAEVLIDGTSYGPQVEGLVTVRNPNKALPQRR